MKTSKIIDNYLDIFFISAISAVLAVRFYLHINHYPQIGHQGIHIAHVLWGGLFMTITIFLLLIYYHNRKLRHLAAAFGGIGFGLFVDETGKFITQDNNYFFQPTIAIIYAIFVILYLSIKTIEKHAQKHLPLPTIHTNTPLKFEHYLTTLYQKTIRTRRFSYFIITFFSTQSVITLGQALLTLFPHPPKLFFIQWAELVSSIISGAFVILGISRIHHRLSAYRLFRYSVLISIFLTQVFVFYQDQLSALTGLTLNLLSFFTLNYLIEQEKLYRHTHPKTTKK